MNYWLMKSEPGDYSIDDLKRDKKIPWDGVRNYQARNFMRDEMEIGDQVIFYHSNANPPHIAGFAQVASKSYPDATQFDKKSKYYDAKSTKENPRWMLVDISYVNTCKQILSLSDIKADSKLDGIRVAQKG